MTTVDVLHKVNLVEGEFTAAEASDVVSALINEKINFHKLHRLSMCEGNIHSDTSFDDSRLAQLMREKEALKMICREAKLAGKKVRISGQLDLEFYD